MGFVSLAANSLLQARMIISPYMIIWLIEGEQGEKASNDMIELFGFEKKKEFTVKN
jgi:hypothetical protein